MRSPLLSVFGTLCKRFNAAFSTECLRTFGNGRKLFRFSKKRVRIAETRAKHRFWQEISTSFFKVRRSLGKGGRQPPRSVTHKNFFVEQSCFRSAFSQFFPPRAPPSRPPEPLTKQLPPLSRPAFLFTVQRPQTAILLPLLR